jgi:hypothetical protein
MQGSVLCVSFVVASRLLIIDHDECLRFETRFFVEQKKPLVCCLFVQMFSISAAGMVRQQCISHFTGVIVTIKSDD